MRKAVLKKIRNIHMKVAGPQLYEKETPRQMFPLNIAKFLRTLILKNICLTAASDFLKHHQNTSSFCIDSFFKFR